MYLQLTEDFDTRGTWPWHHSDDNGKYQIQLQTGCPFYVHTQIQDQNTGMMIQNSGYFDRHINSELQEQLEQASPEELKMNFKCQMGSQKTTVPPLHDVLAPSVSSLAQPDIGRIDKKGTVGQFRRCLHTRRPKYQQLF